MSKKVVRTGDSFFFSEKDSSYVKKAIDKSFEVTENFSSKPYGISFDSTASQQVTDDGVQTTSNASVTPTNQVKIYIARYRKFSCDWENVIYYGVLNSYENITLNEWAFIYTNDKYAAYRMYAASLPSSLPFGGELPPQTEVPFIRYESYKNIYMRRECQFKYDVPFLEFSSTPGTDEWELTSSNNDECEFKYVKSTPYGCDLEVPSNSTIVLSEDCSCIDATLSSSSSSTDSSDSKSSNSSTSSDSSGSSESSSLNSSSSEERRSPKSISTLYLRIVGDPFTENQYILSLQDPSADTLVWSASSHNSNTLTTGVISLTMNYSGRFLLSANVVVDGSPIVISNAVLSNIRNENFAYLNNYLKAVAPVDSDYIATKYDGVDSYDCILSHQSMVKSGGKNKKLSEIIYDYEMDEMTVDRSADKIVLYINRALFTTDSRPNNICRAWGLFCLSNSSDGVWSYSSGNQSLRLEQSEGGIWNLNRRYYENATTIQEINIPINFQDVTNNGVSNYDGFIGLTVTDRTKITGGVDVSSTSDICNDINTLIVFYSSDSCTVSDEYIPYNGDLLLTLDGGNWVGKKSYSLKKQSISSNLSVWNWSTNTSDGNHEYVTLFSPDGILWKLNIGKTTSSGSKNYLYTEFIAENRSADNFLIYAGKIHKSFVNMDGDWSDSDMSFVISEK